MAKRINLLEGNITSALTKLALPIMGMSFIQMAYNLTDIFWIGKIGPGSVAAVGTGGLIIWFCTGLHMITQLGGQVYVAQNLGARDTNRAADFAKSALFLSAILSLILGFIFLYFTNPVVSFFRLNDPAVISGAKIYIKITGGLIIFQLLTKMLTTLITTTGNSKTPFLATSIGLIFNMILDPLLIFGFLGFPKLGIFGAAIATVLAQVIVFSILFIYCLRDKHLFGMIKWTSLPNLDYCKRIIKLSLPVTIQATLFPLISMIISRLVAGYGDNAVAVQRIGSQIESISWMTSEGFAVAVNSFIAQNTGANNIKRARRGYYHALTILSIWGALSTLILIFGAKPLFSVFLDDPTVVIMGKEYLIILGISQLFMCWEILSSNAMNAFGKTTLPAAISITFTGLRIPMALALSASILALNGIWWSITISSILKGIFLLLSVVLYLRKIYKSTYTNNPI